MHRASVALLMVVTLAGCAADPGSPPLAAEPTATSSLTASEGPAAELTVDTPFLLSAMSGPDGPVAAFRWRIPEGAIRSTPLPDGGAALEMKFEIVPLADASPVEQFAVLAVSVKGEATVLWSYADGPQRGFTSTNLSAPVAKELRPRFEAGFGSPSAEGLQVGDEVVFVVAARSAQPVPFGLLWSPVPDRAGQPETGATTPEELLDGRQAVTLPLAARGMGLQVAQYTSSNVFFPGLAMHEEMRSEDIEVEERRRAPTEPMATARDMTVFASFPGAGYSDAIVAYLVAGVAPCPLAGTYDIDLDLHGSVVDSHNVLVTGAPAEVTGIALVQASGDGEGPASSRLAVQVSHACSLEFSYVRQFDLGATLESLTGVPAPDRQSTMPGVLGNLPPEASRRLSQALMVA